MIRAATVVTRRRIALNKLSKCSYATEAPMVHIQKPSIAGQPLFHTHPHLVKPNELTEGIPSEEYERRRRQLMDSLPDGSLVISVAAPIKYMSQRIFYKFRQASDFWYLTGFQEPDSAVILEKDGSSRGYRMTLFCATKEAEWEKWNGARTGTDAAVNTFKADDARDIMHLPSHIKSLINRYSHIYVDGSTSRRRKSIMSYLRPSLTPKTESDSIIESLSGNRRHSLEHEVFKMRLIKSDVEQQLMRNAADISSHAHTKTMRFARPGRLESELAAHFEYTCAIHGAQRLAYVPVVASGGNALTIHYTANNHVINSGEMVLIDAGCEYNGYASDITRTWPVNGKFTEPQKALYQAVLNAQKACIELCTESANLNLMDLHQHSCKSLTYELRKIGFSLNMNQLEQILYPHFLSHSIGIDLHETSNNRTDRLKTGMVITVEPGVYVPPHPQFPKEFHNMGIRIEDEVLVLKNHPLVLSINAPKEVVDVEGACQGHLELGTTDERYIASAA